MGRIGKSPGLDDLPHESYASMLSLTVGLWDIYTANGNKMIEISATAEKESKQKGAINCNFQLITLLNGNRDILAR